MKNLLQKFSILFACFMLAFTFSAGQAWAAGGPVFLSGDDADAGGHCQGSDCGQLYGKALNFVVTNSQSAGTQGIVAIGANSCQARNAIISWDDPGNAGPGAGITHVNNSSTPSIATVNFSNYKAIYIASTWNETCGGMTAAELTALNARQADIVDFVNNQGGGLMALTEVRTPGTYGWLPLTLTNQDKDHFGPDINPTPEMNIIAPGVTSGDLNHGCCYHTIFTGPPGFSGLNVLAYHDHLVNGQRNGVYDGPGVDEVLILGGVQVTIQGNIQLDPPNATLNVGDQHTVTATAQDGNPPAPIAGATVTFTVGGANAGASGTCNNAGCVTDANGQVSFTYTGNNGGTDNISASFIDGNGTQQTSNTVNAEWEQNNQPPDADAGPDQTVEATGATTAVILDGSGSSDPDGDPLAYAWSGDATGSGVGPTVNLPLGTHTITLTVDDGNGGTDTDTVTITVVDTTGPTADVSCLGTLWPPNHKMVVATTVTNVSDAVDGNPTVSITVTSDQPLNDTGDGNTDADWEVSQVGNDWVVKLRAERAGTIGDRTYTVTVTITDASGNVTTEVCETVVPHDQGKGKK